MEKGNAWVTFCMSTFKRPELLKKTLRSILDQSFKYFEVVISDNDPDASAESVVKEINDKRIKYYNNGENVGMIKSFNRSIDKAETEFIVMITDDDPVYPEMLQTLYSLYIEYPGYGVYHGGCDLVCNTEMVAKTINVKVGTNSCLSSEQSIGQVSTYSDEQFPHYFFKNKISNYMLWSIGAVRKEILKDIGGIPDYGSPYMGDLCYTALVCSHSGVVVINTALGCQVLHGGNFGYAEYNNLETLYITPGGFYEWICQRMGRRKDWETLKPEILSFIGRWMVGHSLLVRRYLTIHNFPDKDFKKALNRIFKISYLQKWKMKYYIASKFPILFKFLIELKSTYLK